MFATYELALQHQAGIRAAADRRRLVRASRQPSRPGLAVRSWRLVRGSRAATPSASSAALA